MRDLSRRRMVRCMRNALCSSGALRHAPSLVVQRHLRREALPALRCTSGRLRTPRRRRLWSMCSRPLLGLVRCELA